MHWLVHVCEAITCLSIPGTPCSIGLIILLQPCVPPFLLPAPLRCLSLSVHHHPTLTVVGDRCLWCHTGAQPVAVGGHARTGAGGEPGPAHLAHAERRGGPRQDGGGGGAAEGAGRQDARVAVRPGETVSQPRFSWVSVPVGHGLGKDQCLSMRVLNYVRSVTSPGNAGEPWHRVCPSGLRWACGVWAPSSEDCVASCLDSHGRAIPVPTSLEGLLRDSLRVSGQGAASSTRGLVLRDLLLCDTRPSSVVV